MVSVFRKYRVIGWAFVAVFAAQTAAIPAARAGMVGTDVMVRSGQQDKRAAIRAFLAKDRVRAALQEKGVSPDEAVARVTMFSDAEVTLIAAHINDDPAGQGLVGLVVLAGLVALIVILISDATGKTHVF